MKKLILCFSTFTALTLVLCASLPTESQELLRKLEDFSKDERQKVEDLIQEKTDAVIRILESHLQEETTNGNLNRAVAIRMEIDRLKGEDSLKEIVLGVAVTDKKIEQKGLSEDLKSLALSYYTFDDKTIENTVSSANNGELEGAEFVKNQPYGYGLELGDKRTANLNDQQLRRDFTISFLINLRDLANHQALLSKHDDKGENIFIFGIYEDGYHLRIREATITRGEPKKGLQHFVIVGRENSSETEVEIYQNGELLWEGVLNDKLGDMKGKAWAVGQEWDGDQKSDFGRGIIDEIALFRKDLKGEQLNSLLRTYK